MNYIINSLRPSLYFGVSVLLIGLLVLIVKSSLFEISSNVLSLTITIDLLISIPVIHYLLIRKSRIPKTSVSTIVVLGLVVGVIVIPFDNQQYLNLFRIWFLPLVEIGIVLFVIYEVRKVIRKSKEAGELTVDLFTAFKDICYQLVPRPLAALLSTEISVLYYGLFYWKKRVLKSHEFSYHKNNTTISTMAGFMLVLSIETFALHAFLMDMSSKAAWILTFCSLYTLLQIFGFLKSIIKRPISIEKDTLILRYGILRESYIHLSEIESFEISSRKITFNKKTRRLSPIEVSDGHNVILKLNTENVYSGFYGFKRRFKTIVFYLDNTQEFRMQLEKALQQR